MAEYLVNTMNRHDNYPPKLVFDNTCNPDYAHMSACGKQAWISLKRSRHCVSSASSHISKYFGQQWVYWYVENSERLLKLYSNKKNTQIQR